MEAADGMGDHAGIFSYNYILFFFLTWFPSYLNHSLHIDIKEISIATVIPWFIGAIGMVLGGVCSDFIYRITGNAYFLAV